MFSELVVTVYAATKLPKWALAEMPAGLILKKNCRRPLQKEGETNTVSASALCNKEANSVAGTRQDYNYRKQIV